MNKVIGYHEEVWMRAVSEAESEVMRRAPSICGGKKEHETVEEYVHRGFMQAEHALERLRSARAELARIQAGPATTLTTTKRKPQREGGGRG